MSFLSSFKRTPPPPADSLEREHLLAYIESHASKDDLTRWLLQDYGLSFPPNAEWADIKQRLIQEQTVPDESLKNYAAQLAPDKDTAEVLAEVVAETKKAQALTQELRFLTVSKTVAIAVGGMLAILGLLFLLTMVALLLELVPVELNDKLRVFAGLLAGIIGLVQLVGGLLLVAR